MTKTPRLHSRRWLMALGMAALVIALLVTLAACTGAEGKQGPPGSAGQQGAAGPAGPQGPEGKQGPAGPAGAQGATGAQGPAGAQGPVGPKGDNGATGPAGSQGAIGAQGPAGPQGATGAQGSAGPAGPTGATYVGTASCTACHKSIADVFAKSGHPFKLIKVTGGQAPKYPFSEVLNPPTGYTWNDITYVIGGYGWKARFIDKNGYIITGADAKATTQYNLPNATLGKAAGWVGYNAGRVQMKYNCGPCHTTGYKPTGNQDGLAGLVGTWAEPGITCENCHGPGSNHVSNPYGVAMEVDRSSEVCGACHSRDAVVSIDASGGFIQHHEQYEELFQSKHRALSCVACHDPHKGVIQGRQTNTSTVKVECSSCHFKEAQNQKSAVMKQVVKCIDCHMPRIVKSAWGDTATFTGDIRAHMWAIDPYATAQFSADGKTAISQVSLDFACKSCHRTGGSALPKTDDQLKSTAVGYHNRP